MKVCHFLPLCILIMPINNDFWDHAFVVLEKHSRHSNGHQLCPSPSRHIYVLIRSGIHTVFALGWMVVLRINVDLAIFQPYLDLEAGDNQSLKIQVARPGIEPWSSCSASQELNHSATAASSRLERIS